ncbi:MAG: trigger factor [Spirochaetaceae bacterium]|nr:trigger factor [Spirochaetaceae bacterium]
MISQKDISYEKSQAKIKLVIAANEAQKQYNQLLTKYSKEARIDGFRPGKVPLAVMESKYGEAIKAETLNNLIQQSFQEVLPTMEQQPLYYSSPALLNEEELSFDFNNDVQFTLAIDVEPKFTTPNYKEVAANSYTVKVNDEEVAKELERLQQQNALAVDKTGVSAKGDVVTANYAELDDAGNEIEDTKRQGFAFTIGEGNTFYEFDDEVIGLAKNEEKIITKSYAADHKFKDLAGRTVKIKTSLTSIKERKIPELDDDFALDISEKYQNLADLKADIAVKLAQSAEQAASDKRFNEIMIKLIDKVEVDIPESMITQETERRFSELAAQSGLSEENLLKMLGGNIDALSPTWREDNIRAIKRRLIITNIVKEENIEATPDEVEAEAVKLAGQHDMAVEELKRQLGPNFETFLLSDLLEKKAIELLSSSAKVLEVKELTLSEFADLVNKEEQALRQQDDLA